MKRRRSAVGISGSTKEENTKQKKSCTTSSVLDFMIKVSDDDTKRPTILKSSAIARPPDDENDIKPTDDEQSQHQLEPPQPAVVIPPSTQHGMKIEAQNPVEESDDDLTTRKPRKADSHKRRNSRTHSYEGENEEGGLSEEITAAQAVVAKKNRQPVKKSSYNFDDGRPQIRELATNTKQEITKRTSCRHQQALLHRIVRDLYVKHEKDYIDMQFSNGYYAAGIIRVIVSVYYESSRERHVRLWFDGASDIPPDHQRVLWLLCMSRKGESKMQSSMRKSTAGNNERKKDDDERGIKDDDERGIKDDDHSDSERTVVNENAPPSQRITRSERRRRAVAAKSKSSLLGATKKRRWSTIEDNHHTITLRHASNRRIYGIDMPDERQADEFTKKESKNEQQFSREDNAKECEDDDEEEGEDDESYADDTGSDSSSFASAHSSVSSTVKSSRSLRQSVSSTVDCITKESVVQKEQQMERDCDHPNQQSSESVDLKEDRERPIRASTRSSAVQQPATQKNCQTTKDNDRGDSKIAIATANFKDALIQKALGIPRLQKPAEETERRTLVDDDYTRFLREQHGAATRGVKYEDTWDPTSHSLLWFSQARDLSSQISDQIVSDFRTGLADVMLAARGAHDHRWITLGAPIDIRPYKYSELLMPRGGMAVSTVKKGVNLARFILHFPSLKSKTLKPLCSDVDRAKYEGQKVSRVTYDGLDQHDIEERRKLRHEAFIMSSSAESASRWSAELNAILSERRMITATKMSIFCPIDCCKYCSWRPPRLWFKIDEKDTEKFNEIFLAKNRDDLNTERRAPLKETKNDKLKSKKSPEQRTQSTLDCFFYCTSPVEIIGNTTIHTVTKQTLAIPLPFLSIYGMIDNMRLLSSL